MRHPRLGPDHATCPRTSIMMLRLFSAAAVLTAACTPDTLAQTFGVDAGAGDDFRFETAPFLDVTFDRDAVDDGDEDFSFDARPLLHKTFDRDDDDDAEIRRLLSGVSPGSLSGTEVNEYPERLNSFGFGGSVGWQLDKNAWFWGLTADYGRALDEHWSLGLSLAYDRETERRTARPDKVVNTLTLIGTVSYALTEHFSLTTGLAKGFAHDDNRQRSFKFANGDWGTGVAVGLSYPLKDNLFFFLSGAYEYNLSENESSISFDVGLSFVF